MIILRYFSRQILETSAGVSLVLLLVVLSGRFIQFLDKAADGELSVELMLTMILWRIPSSLELILPLALTLAVLLVIGRMNQESELIILRAAGYSDFGLFRIILLPSVIVALLVGWLSFFLSPDLARVLDSQVVEKENLTVFDTVVPGRFQSDKSGRLIYATDISADRESLIDVFIVEPLKRKKNEVFLTGRTARLEFNEGEKYLVLLDGYQHIGSDVSLDWEISKFDRYLIRLTSELDSRPDSLEARATSVLLESGMPAELAIVSWRASLPIMCIFMLPFVFLIGRGSSRQSRFLWIIPVILIQFGYITALSYAQKAIILGQWSPWPGLLWIHMILIGAFGVFFGLGSLARRKGWL